MNVTAEFKSNVDKKANQEADIVHVIQYCLKFKRQKTLDYDVFKERYIPVISYWVSRLQAKHNLETGRAHLQFFDQDGDNFIKNLITLRITLECINE